jgi:ribonuclease HII
MRRAASALCADLVIDLADIVVLVDGNRPMPEWQGPQRTLVKGDARSWAIAAASIVAKVHRDAEMRQHDATWPAYGFGQHKGYPTPAHLAALRAHGPTPIHRRSFAPVAALLANATSSAR